MKNKTTTRCKFLIAFNHKPNSETAVSELENLQDACTERIAETTALNNFLIELGYE